MEIAQHLEHLMVEVEEELQQLTLTILIRLVGAANFSLKDMEVMTRSKLLKDLEEEFKILILLVLDKVLEEVLFGSNQVYSPLLIKLVCLLMEMMGLQKPLMEEVLEAQLL